MNIFYDCYKRQNMQIVKWQGQYHNKNAVLVLQHKRLYFISSAVTDMADVVFYKNKKYLNQASSKYPVESAFTFCPHLFLHLSAFCKSKPTFSHNKLILQPNQKAWYQYVLSIKIFISLSATFHAPCVLYKHRTKWNS